MPEIKLITTEDGSHSLLREDLDETYHSFRGAKGESMHVFIDMGLNHVISQSKKDMVRIFEVGLGTGLNAFLSAQFAEQHRLKIEFHSVEPIPVSQAIYSQLNFASDENEKQLLMQIHEGKWEDLYEINRFFSLAKYETTLEDTSGFDKLIALKGTFDVIYFDAFAPTKQPEVWVLENISTCFDLLKQGGVLTCYSAQGHFKRNLIAAGFTVEKLTGALGKREMIRATKS